jgi:hypothetical protein
MKRLRILCLLAILGVQSQAVGDMVIEDYQDSRHNRFYSGSDKDFVGQAFDWSGVGQTQDGNWVTMISSQYFLSAAHYAPSAGGTVTFYSTNDDSGPSYQGVVAPWAYQTRYTPDNLPSDLWLGKLTTPIPSSAHITYYPVLDLPYYDDYLGDVIYVNGKPNRVGRNVIDRFELGQEEDKDKNIVKETVSMGYDYDTVNGLGADECYLQIYDSGGPSFVDAGGRLALVGIHYYINQLPGELRYSADSFVPYYINQLNDHMSGASVSTVTPEPSTAMLLVISAAVTGAVAWRRRQRAA